MSAVIQKTEKFITWYVKVVDDDFIYFERRRWHIGKFT